MKLISLVLTFILSAQLVYANATVCDNFGKCGTSMTSDNTEMKDCPFHSSQKTEDKKENKQETKTQCKCCAVLTLETKFISNPSLETVISFIEFQYFESHSENISTSFLRPPIV